MVFKGDDLLKIKSQDMGKCSEACKGLTPCESWTYNHERSTCYLKGKDGPQKIRIQEGFTSGVIIKRKQMPDFNTSNCPDAEKVWVRHNELRLWHDAEPLEWDDALAAQAQAWADSCPNSHSPAALAGNYGENMGLGHHDCSYALEGFYAEAQYYTPGGDAAGNMGALHFTQVVWKDTKQLGCGWSYCNGDSRVVCQYMNGGNRIGHFDANVSR
jgi:pathogenesis-related protein 1